MVTGGRVKNGDIATEMLTVQEMKTVERHRAERKELEGRHRLNKIIDG